MTVRKQLKRCDKPAPKLWGMKLRLRSRGSSPTVREGVLSRNNHALPYGRATAPRYYLPAAMLAIVFRFLRSSFASLPRALERYELASILLNSISVRTVIVAPVAASGGNA